MKKQRVLLLMFLVVSTAVDAASVNELNEWFTRVKRGASCFIKQEACNQQDAKAMYQAATAIAGALILAAGAIGIRYFAKRTPPTPGNEEELNFIKLVQYQPQEALNIWQAKGDADRQKLAKLRLKGGTLDYHIATLAMGPLATRKDINEQELSNRLNLIEGIFVAGAKESMSPEDIDSFESQLKKAEENSTKLLSKNPQWQRIKSHIAEW